MYKVFNLKLENGKKGIENINEDIFAQFNSKSFIEENFSGIMDAIRELFPVFPNNDYNGGYNNFENWFYQNYGNISVTKIKNVLSKLKKFDIFVSHAHKDETLAIKFAYLSHKELHLNCFIDSIYWKNFNDLVDERIRDLKNLKYIDPQDEEQYIRTLTTYGNINLQIALSEMMNNCESLFFLNTNNSIKYINLPKESTIAYTNWIFYEIYTACTMQRKVPYRIKKISCENVVENNYSMDVNNLSVIDFEIIEQLMTYSNHKNCFCDYCIDFFYRHICIRKNKFFRCLLRRNTILDILYDIVE